MYITLPPSLSPSVLPFFSLTCPLSLSLSLPPTLQPFIRLAAQSCPVLMAAPFGVEELRELKKRKSIRRRRRRSAWPGELPSAGTRLALADCHLLSASSSAPPSLLPPCLPRAQHSTAQLALSAPSSLLPPPSSLPPPPPPPVASWARGRIIHHPPCVCEGARRVYDSSSPLTPLPYFSACPAACSTRWNFSPYSADAAVWLFLASFVSLIKLTAPVVDLNSVLWPSLPVRQASPPPSLSPLC